MGVCVVHFAVEKAEKRCYSRMSYRRLYKYGTGSVQSQHYQYESKLIPFALHNYCITSFLSDPSTVGTGPQ
jgi:hypothetical protein